MLHVLRRNVNLTILLFNNRIYGLTKGQYSPTSELGKTTKSTPMGSADRPINPCAFALGVGATFVARTVDRNIAHMEETLRKAAAHRGAAFVEILQNCNIYNDMAWGILYDRESKIEHELRVEHGKPLVVGAAHARKGLVLDGLKARVVGVDEVPAERLWVHDQNDIASALVLASLASPQFPVPVGVLAQVEAPIYEDLIADQEKRAVSERGPGDIARLLTSGDTWTIH
jgi:2-oxoglutarate ferredoxin oxidoreductase subunit beta